MAKSRYIIEWVVREHNDPAEQIFGLWEIQSDIVATAILTHVLIQAKSPFVEESSAVDRTTGHVTTTFKVTSRPTS